MNSELEENRELADNRLTELQKLQQDLQTVHQENNNMKVLIRHFSHSMCFDPGVWKMKMSYLRSRLQDKLQLSLNQRTSTSRIF